MPASKAQQKAVAKYMKENYGEIKMRVSKEEKERIKRRADELDLSVNAYLHNLFKKDIGEE